VCESKRTDIIHLSLQTMAFPWFGDDTSRQKQVKNYQGVNITFPEIFHHNVTTSKTSEGYKTYLMRFLNANLHKREIFLDIHGVEQTTFGSFNSLFNDELIRAVPYGYLYHIVPTVAQEKLPQMLEDRRFQREAYDENLMRKLLQSEVLKEEKEWRKNSIAAWTSIFHKLRLSSMTQVPNTALLHLHNHILYPGSWEFAALSIVYDGMYTTALYELEYARKHNERILKGPITNDLLQQYMISANRALQYFELVYSNTQASILSIESFVLFSYPVKDLISNAVVTALEAYKASVLDLTTNVYGQEQNELEKIAANRLNIVNMFVKEYARKYPHSDKTPIYLDIQKKLYARKKKIKNSEGSPAATTTTTKEQEKETPQ